MTRAWLWVRATRSRGSERSALFAEKIVSYLTERGTNRTIVYPSSSHFAVGQRRFFFSTMPPPVQDCGLTDCTFTHLTATNIQGQSGEASWYGKTRGAENTHTRRIRLPSTPWNEVSHLRWSKSALADALRTNMPAFRRLALAESLGGRVAHP
jgi:hypothetical protein